MNMMKKSLDEYRPDLVILIDYPDFNLPLAKAAKKRGIKVFYYISPQVWAWRKSRIGQIKKTVNKMAVILPFEVDTYSQKGFCSELCRPSFAGLGETGLFQARIEKNDSVLAKVKPL